MVNINIQKNKIMWNSTTIKALRKSLDMSQIEFSKELGVRQQTVSEWETGVYSPRGGSLTLLKMISQHALEHVSNVKEKNNTQVEPPQEVLLNSRDGKNIIYPQLIRRKIKPIYYNNVSSANNRQALPI